MPILLPRYASGYNRSLLAVTWLVTIIATIALCGKIYARYQRFKRLYWDDFFVVLGWAFAVPIAFQCTFAFSLNATLDMGRGSLFLSKPLTQFFFYSAIWCIKISFLIFFKRIGAHAMQRLKKYWTCVLWFTIVAYFACWTVNPYGCWVKHGVRECETESYVRAIRPLSLGITTGLVVLTDCLILVIPFAILSKLQRIQPTKKLVLYMLFSVEIVTVVVAIIRCVVSTEGMTSDKGLQVSLLLFLTNIEANIAIIIACVGSLRSLFSHDDNSNPGSHATPKPQTNPSRVGGKPIGQPFSVRSIPMDSFSSNSHKRTDSMKIPLSQSSALPSRRESLELHGSKNY